MSISRTCRCFAALIVVVAVWASSFFIAEAAFRLLGDKPSSDLGGLFTGFGDHSYRLAPEVHTGANWASGAFEVATDGLGLRCDVQGRFRAEPGTTVDFLFLGDSQGFGNGVSFKDTIPGVVAERAATRNLSAANASVGGHGPRNQIEIVKELQERYRLSVNHFVVLLTPGMTMYGNSYTRASVGTDGRLYGKKTTRLEEVWIFLKQNSVSYSRLRNAIRNLGIGSSPSAAAPFIFQVYATDFKEQEARANLTSFLKTVLKFAKGEKNAVTVAYLPITVEVDFSGVEAAAKASGLIVDRDQPLNLAREVTRTIGLQFINLRPILARKAKEGITLHLKGDYHYDSDLSRACGDELWRHLAQGTKSSKKSPSSIVTKTQL